MTVKVYQLREKEVHMMGENVGVVWCVKTSRHVEKKGHKTITVEEYEREGDPYVDFLWIRDEHGEVWEDDDNVDQGGMDLEIALGVAEELLLACDYIKHKEWEK